MQDRSSQLGTERIPRLLVRLSAPATFALLMSAGYNLADTIFLGQWVGAVAIGALAVSLSVQIFLMAIAQTTGIGGASIISRSLGAGDRERAEIGLGNAISLSIGLSAVVAAACLVLIRTAATVIGATPEILPHVVDYLTVILIGSPFFVFAMTGNFLIRAEGDARTAMIAMALGAVLNIALDPVFIYVLGMGTRGAALATVIAQGVAAAYIVSHYRKGRSGLRVRARNLIPRLDVAIEMFKIGSGSFARMIAGSFAVVFLNRTLGFYGGTTAIAAYGVINRLLHFAFMPVMGFAQALQPVAGFNYGAKRFAMAKRALTISSVRSTVFATSAFAVIMIFSRPLIGMFTRDSDLIELTVPAIRMIVLAFPVIAIQVMGAALFQAFGRARQALFLSLSRQIIFLIPLVLTLPLSMGLRGIFVAFPAADILAVIVTAIMLAREFARLDRSEAAGVSVA